MVYSNWPEKRIGIGSLKLDPFNPRFPDKGRINKPEAEIIKELVDNYDVEFLANLIAFYGYFPTESLIAYREKGKVYVIEGNRRLTACKLLMNPASAPFGYEKKFKDLSDQIADKTDIQKLRVVFAPDRDSAIPILINKHTRSSIVDWEPIMKNMFYADLLERFSEEELKEKYNIGSYDLNKSKIGEDLYNAAKKLELDEDVLEIVHDEHKFPITTLVRAMACKPAKEYFKMSVVKGRIEMVTNPAEFLPPFREVVIRLAKGDLDSRKLNSNGNIEKELRGLIKAGIKEPTPSLATPISLEEASESFISKTTGSPKKKVQRKRKVKKTPLKGIITPDFSCNSANERIKLVCEELQLINCEELPNASALLLRLFLELATYNYLNSSGELKLMETAAKGTGTKLPPTFPELRKMLDWIITKGTLGNTQVTNALNLFIQKNGTEPILLQLNQYVHNFAYHPEVKDLRYIWKSLSEYFKIVL